MTKYENRNYLHLQKKEKPRTKYTINSLLKKLILIRNKKSIQKVRADKWSDKYAKDLKHYKKVLIDNEQLRKTNQELNLMHHQAVVKVLNLGQEIIKLKGKK